MTPFSWPTPRWQASQRGVAITIRFAVLPGNVVGLTPPAGGTSSGCAEVERELALAIIRNPENYYVNVHNVEYPAGALRGQLSG